MLLQKYLKNTQFAWEATSKEELNKLCTSTLYEGRDRMRIEHIGIWTSDLERSRLFYKKYFGADSGEKYVNEKKGFSSYFLTFESGCRLEIMTMLNSDPNSHIVDEKYVGISHFSISPKISVIELAVAKSDFTSRSP